jgi:hypothetical protein
MVGIQIFYMASWLVSLSIGINLMICLFASVTKRQIEKLQRVFHVVPVVIPTILYIILAATETIGLDNDASMVKNVKGSY